MADCSRTIEFSRELHRLCESEATEDGACSKTCPFKDDNRMLCPICSEITQKQVDILQKWNDEHPKPKTYLDKLLEAFPNAVVVVDGDNRFPLACRANMYGDIELMVNCNRECAKCWNEVIE